LLAALKGDNLLAGGALPVHSEPKNRDKKTGDAGDDILTDFQPFFACKLTHALIVGLDLSRDRRAIHIAILRLHNCNRRRRAACTGRAQHHYRAQRRGSP
jgi:hypothetical protein